MTIIQCTHDFYDKKKSPVVSTVLMLKRVAVEVDDCTVSGFWI